MKILRGTAVLLIACAATTHSLSAASCERAGSGFVQALTREDEDRRQKVFTVWLRLQGDGTLLPVSIQDIAWPEPLRSATEEELTAARADDDAYGGRRTYRVVNVRAYDADDRLIFRTNAVAEFEIEVGRHMIHISTPTLFFNVPAETHTISLTGWMAQQDVRLDLKTLLSDPRLRTDELMRR